MTNPSSLILITTAALLTAPTRAQKSKRSINTETILADDAHPSTAKCDISCLNGGTCTFIEYFDYPVEGKHGYYMGCKCPSTHHGGQCELLVQSKSNVGAPIAFASVALLILGITYRRKRQQSRRRRDDRINSHFLDNLKRDLDNICTKKGDDECSLEEVEFDRRDTRGSLNSIENGVDAEYL